MASEQRAEILDPSNQGGDQEVCAVMVTYQGGRLILQTVGALLSQVGHLVIVDNHSEAETLACIERLKQAYPDKITVMMNSRNLGIAAALNQGVAYARANQFRFVLTMDQDSLPAADMVERLMAVYEKAAGRKIGAVGPNMRLIYDGDKELPGDSRTGADGIEAEVVWTSGCLHPTSVFDDVGIFREEYFIDCIDYEFCFRLKQAGYHVLKAPAARLTHRKGEVTTAPFLWRRCFVSNYGASRRYYMARNGMLYWLESRAPDFLMAYMRMHLNEITKIVFYERDKTRKLRFMLRGLVDGLKKKAGALAAS